VVESQELGRFPFMERKTIALNRVVDSVMMTDMEGFAVLSVRRRRLDNVGLSSRHGVGGHLKPTLERNTFSLPLMLREQSQSLSAIFLTQDPLVGTFQYSDCIVGLQIGRTRHIKQV
jgi:hypothetical protein